MINRYSVKKINKLSDSREIWCWGCGVQYGKMINAYGDEAFVRRIQGLIDSNEKLWGTHREVGDRKIPVCGPEALFREKRKKYLLILSSDAYEAIYARAVGIFRGIDVVYTVYPKFYAELSNWLQDLFGKMPLRRQLLFYVSGHSGQAKDNADELVKYLQEEYRGKPYRLVYLTDYPCDVPKGVKWISFSDVQNKPNKLNRPGRVAARCRESIDFTVKLVRYHYYYAGAKYIFSEDGPAKKVRSQQKTFYLNHGLLPLKDVRDALKQPESLDYGVCPGLGCAKLYEEQYSINRHKLIYMMPARTRRLFVDESEKVDQLLETKGMQMILWLPTFRKLERGGGKPERRDSKGENPVSELMHSDHIHHIDHALRRSGQKLALKGHPRGKDDLAGGGGLANIIVTTDAELENHGINTHSLMNRADALIADYSSVAFEYMFLDRPLGYYIPDLQTYTRGFSVENPLDYMPGFKMNNGMELLKFLGQVKEGKDDFALERRRLKQMLFGDTDPHNGAKELVEFLDKREKQ